MIKYNDALLDKHQLHKASNSNCYNEYCSGPINKQSTRRIVIFAWWKYLGKMKITTFHWANNHEKSKT